MAKRILGYWDIRGTAEPIRCLLHYKKVDFVDKKYSSDNKGFQKWQKESSGLSLDFPVLPYYIDGDIKLTHSTAIMRYLGYKFGMNGNTNDEKRRVVIAEQNIVDFRDKLRSFVSSKEFETIKKMTFMLSVRPLFEQWERFIGKRNFVAGGDIFYPDFLVFETLDFYRLYHEPILNYYPSLKAYFNRMKNLPGIQEYLSSQDRKAWPIFCYNAKFGGSGDPPKHL